MYNNRLCVIEVELCVFVYQNGTYFDLARTNDVVITSRSFGSYRLVPIGENDSIIDQATLDSKIRRSIEEYEKGKVYRMNEG